MKCKCDYRKYMLGDGCTICNPAKALEYAYDAIKELEAERNRYEQALNTIRLLGCRCIGDCGCLSGDARTMLDIAKGAFRETQ